MKLDSLSSLAEIMPFYGTLDQVWRTMRLMSIKSKMNLNDWKVMIGRIVKRKKINISFTSFLKVLDKEDEDLLRKIELYEIDLVRVSTLENYRLLNKSLEKSKVKHFLKINRLQLSLWINDDFDMTYERAWRILEYTDEDRKIDKEYNRTIELIEDLNIESLESFLYLNEIKKRKIKYLDRAILFINENMDPNEFDREIITLEQTDITLNKICWVLSIYDSLNFKKDEFSHIKWFKKELPWELIEIFANSKTQENIMMPFLIYPYDLYNSYNFIYIKPDDWFIDYKQNFHKSACFDNDYFISAHEGLMVIDNCSKGKWKLWKFSSLMLKTEYENIYHARNMVRIINWNQMLIETKVDDAQYSPTTEEVNRMKTEWKWYEKLSGLTINPTWIKSIYEDRDNSKLYLKYPNIKKYKATSFDFSKQQKVITDNNEYNDFKKTVRWDIQGFINVDSKESVYLNNLKELRNWSFENLEIKIDWIMDCQKVKNLIDRISKIKKLNKLHLTIDWEDTLDRFTANIFTLSKKIRLIIESKSKIDTYIILKLKNYFKSFSLKN